MSSQSTPKKRYEITNHPLAAIDHSSDEDLEIDTKGVDQWQIFKKIT